MKVKADFITNSSSASFIMKFIPVDRDISLEEFKEKLNSWIESYKRRNPNSIRFWSGSDVTEEFIDGKITFSITEWTSMHNDTDDIPHYMRELMVESYVKEWNLGFTIDSFEIIDDN